MDNTCATERGLEPQVGLRRLSGSVRVPLGGVLIPTRYDRGAGQHRTSRQDSRHIRRPAARSTGHSPPPRREQAHERERVPCLILVTRQSPSN